MPSRFCQTLFLLSILAAPSLFAFVSNYNSSSQPRRWILNAPSLTSPTNSVNPFTRAIRYSLAAGAFSTTNSAAELNAVRASFDQWQNLSGTLLKFEEAGLITNQVDIDIFDQTNVIFWAKQSTLVNGGRDDISGTLAVTFPRLNADNVILEADIVLNGVEFPWHTSYDDTQSAAYFIEATVLHEIGHFLGLEHSPLGGATMFPRTGPGVGLQAALSTDELAAARSLYGTPQQMALLAKITGRIHAGTPVFGAAVFAEDIQGRPIAGTVTDRDGKFELPGLPPGQFRVRATPLDPPARASVSRMLTGGEISGAFAQANTDFLAVESSLLDLPAGQSVSIELNTVRINPAFRITRIRPPTRDPSEFTAVNAPVLLLPGQSNVTLGVYSPDFRPDSTLTISGPGIAFSSSLFRGNVFPDSVPNLHSISLQIDIKPDAPPGLRTFTVRHGTNLAFAHGFLEIQGPFPDANFDGLDDQFQRRFFDRFTSSQAAPSADPDQDGFLNHAEAAAATVPTDPRSLLQIEQISQTQNGIAVSWQSVPGKKYRLLTRLDLAKTGWFELSPILEATRTTTTFLDQTTRTEPRFYRVQLVQN